MASLSTQASDLTLSQAGELTRKYHPVWQASQFNLQASAAYRRTQQRRNAIYVNVEAENLVGSGEFEGLRSAELSLSLSSVWSSVHKRDAKVAVAEVFYTQAQHKARLRELEILAQMSILFVETLATQESLTLAHESEKNQILVLTLLRERQKKGAAIQSDIVKAQVVLSSNKMLQTRLQAKLARQKRTLADFWQQKSLSFFTLSGDLLHFSSVPSLSSLTEYLQSAPVWLHAMSTAQMSTSQLRLAKVESRADIGWQLGIRRFNDSDDTALIAQVNIPLFTKKREQYVVKQYQAQFNALRYERQVQLTELQSQLTNAYSLYQQARNTVNTLQKMHIPLLEKALKISEKAYFAGRYRYRDLALAREELLAAKQQLIEMASDALLSQMVIEQLVGAQFTAQKRN